MRAHALHLGHAQDVATAADFQGSAFKQYFQQCTCGPVLCISDLLALEVGICRHTVGHRVPMLCASKDRMAIR